MTFIAHTFLHACESGLTLWGQEDGAPEWVGDAGAWTQFKLLEANYERYGKPTKW